MCFAGFRHVSLDETVVADGGVVDDPDLIVLDDVMNALARQDPRKVQVVEMRYFGGLSVEETAEVLKSSTVTVKWDWRAARTWFYRELTATADHAPPTLETN
ncbi:MAG TPA: ECF-type sigma factor [Bryobacteraceae bacterium]|nr:ECF-type sigma factor [Bryobacteraceae bacterium]